MRAKIVAFKASSIATIFLLLGSVFIAAATGPGAKSAPADTVKIDSGPISGLTVGENKDIRVFKGIPYAAPPVGELRWKTPQPVKPWTEVKECVEFGPSEPQQDTLVRVYGEQLGKTNEDCLYLNVYAPAKKSHNLPVMVWIHGGGFTLGSGDGYNGEALARLGAVVVTINYRLGVFGFFAHPQLSKESGHASSGNYGLLDQIAALQWVKRNAAAFGGDSGRITIFGESAGGMSVAMLMSSPLSNGLFQRAIIESGAGFGPGRRLKDLEDAGQRLCSALGVDKSADPIAELRKLSGEELFKQATAHEGLPMSGTGISFGPGADGWALPDDPSAIFAAGRQHSVPLMIGSNRDEGTILLAMLPVPSSEAYEKFARQTFGDKADAVLALYPASIASNPKQVVDIVFRDRIAAASRFLADVNSKKNPNSFQYYFTRGSKNPKFEKFGAFHAAEIPYAFGGAMRGSNYFDARDWELAKTMSAYWVRFAATGDPNGPGLPEWPKYSESTDHFLELGDQTAVRTGVVTRAQADLFNRIDRGNLLPE
jgi:para-nitrobenzyl esterase